MHCIFRFFLCLLGITAVSTVNCQTTLCLFASGSTFAVGSSPRDICVSDFNNDGNKDIVTANASGNTISILLGLGTGSFLTATNFPVGSGPRGITYADFNKDGNMDIATANITSNNVSVLFGTGTGSFSGPITIAATSTSSPFGLVAVDLNNDTYPDIAVSRPNILPGAGSVDIYLGNGTSFSFLESNIVCFGNWEIVAEDFNADSNLDLVVANAGCPSFQILYGDGTGSVTPISSQVVSASPYGITTADFNYDTKKDIVTAGSSNNDISIILATASGGFNSYVTYTIGGLYPNSVTAADLDNNGTMEILTANQNSNNISLLMGNSSGIFSLQNTYPSLGNLPYCIVNADFNNDGTKDIAVSNSGSNNVAVFFVQNCTGINELAENRFNISVCPNPTSGNFVIKSDKENLTLELLDLNNKVLYNYKLTSNSTNLNIDDLSSVIYILKVFNSTGTYYTKIVKQ